MSEPLIKCFLNWFVGEYIQGLNTGNLNTKVLSDYYKMENVWFDPSVIDLLELPWTLKFSKIGKLELKGPFKKIFNHLLNLGSKPAEVFLDGLYVVLNPKAQSEWQFKDYGELIVKLQSVEQFINEYLLIIPLKKKEKVKSNDDDDDDDGNIQKLIMKIVDNLQITIKNIHVRFEDTITNKYSWGFCLDTIETYTTNQNVVDRTDAANKNEPMRKLLKISNVGLYWTDNEERMISNMAEEHKIRILNGMIQRQRESTTKEPVAFLFKLSLLQVSLKMNNKGNFTVPEIKVNLSLDHITLYLQQRQLQQVIKEIEFFSKFKNELSLRKNVFQADFLKMMNLQKGKSVACSDKTQREEFEKAVCVLKIDILKDLTKKVLQKELKALRIKKLEKKKQDEKKGFFVKLFGSNDSASTQKLVTAEDKQRYYLYLGRGKIVDFIYNFKNWLNYLFF